MTDTKNEKDNNNTEKPKIFDYLALNGLYSLHGRSMTTVQGMKLGNPELKPVTFATIAGQK